MQFRKPKVMFDKPQKEELNPAQQQDKKQLGSSECNHSYGYLANRPKNASIPQECLFCLKVVDCLYGIKK